MPTIYKWINPVLVGLLMAFGFIGYFLDADNLSTLQKIYWFLIPGKYDCSLFTGFVNVVLVWTYYALEFFVVISYAGIASSETRTEYLIRSIVGVALTLILLAFSAVYFTLCGLRLDC